MKETNLSSGSPVLNSQETKHFLKTTQQVAALSFQETTDKEMMPSVQKPRSESSLERCPQVLHLCTKRLTRKPSSPQAKSHKQGLNCYHISSTL